MSNLELQNLDRLSAEMGFKMVDDLRSSSKDLKRLERNIKELERIITKALGILIEDGLFAYAIWLESENKMDILDISKKLLGKSGIIDMKNDENNNKSFRDLVLENVSKDIHKMLLGIHLIEKMLIYARYRAKALQNSKEGG